MCPSRNRMANVVLPLVHDTYISSDHLQPIRPLLLRLHCSARFRRRSATGEWHRILLVRAETGAVESAGITDQKGLTIVRSVIIAY